MIGIVEPDAEELADRADAWPQARLAFDERQRRGVERSQRRQAVGRDRVAADIRYVRGKIAQLAIAVDQGRSLLALGSVACELHCEIP